MKRSIVLGATLLLAVLTVSGCKKEDPADAAIPLPGSLQLGRIH